jgi:hypothetical protein
MKVCEADATGISLTVLLRLVVAAAAASEFSAVKFFQAIFSLFLEFCKP